VGEGAKSVRLADTVRRGVRLFFLTIAAYTPTIKRTRSIVRRIRTRALSSLLYYGCTVRILARLPPRSVADSRPRVGNDREQSRPGSGRRFIRWRVGRPRVLYTIYARLIPGHGRVSNGNFVGAPKFRIFSRRVQRPNTTTVTRRNTVRRGTSAPFGFFVFSISSSPVRSL